MEIEIWTATQPQTLSLQSLLPAQCAGTMVAQTCGSGQLIFGLISGMCMRERVHALKAWRARNLRLDNSEA